MKMETLATDIFAAKPGINTVPRGFLVKFFTIEGLASISANLLMYAIFFYMQKRFGWGARNSLMLSGAQGVAYTLGALAANPLSSRFDRQQLLRFLEIGLLLDTLAGAFAPSAAFLVILLFIYAALSATQWPLLESLVSVGATPAQMSRRTSTYNLVWSGTAAATVAACGILIANWPQGIFFAAAAAHVIVLAMLVRIQRQSPHPHAQLRASPELLPLRTMAKRLSRIALPSTFAVIYVMGAIMPTLPVIRAADPEIRTLLAGVWMISRWLCFLVLGATIWWQTRPRAILIAAIIVLAAFLAITLIPSLLSMILWQIALGIAMGLIYSASLYFGMVLSDGSTAQNAYHEALIGVGSVLGPTCGALAGALRPDDPRASVIAVAAILWISVIGDCVVSIQSRKPQDEQDEKRGRS
jgi:MFS family permease